MQGDLLGFAERYQRISAKLRLLTRAGELAGWSREKHGKPTRICTFIEQQYPLAIFHGDVGTGKTVTAECMANRLVTEQPTATDSELFKLSTRVRGSGKVG